jgi:hypothetical protein
MQAVAAEFSGHAGKFRCLFLELSPLCAVVRRVVVGQDRNNGKDALPIQENRF